MEDSPSKPSVAELAGRFKGHILPMPTSNDEFRRRPPCSLKLHNPREDCEESDKTVVTPNPFKIKMKNSAIIEKLQANLALSPTSLLPSPKSPDVKPQPATSSPTISCCPLSPTLRPSHQSSEEEDPVGFSNPPEGNPLPSFNKTRARLSFKRRPPTRQHRRSAGEEAGVLGSALSPCELNSPKENGEDQGQVFNSPAEEDKNRQPASLIEAEEDRDCEKVEEEEVVESDPIDSEELGEGHKTEQISGTSEEGEQPSEPYTAEQIEGAVMEEFGQEEMEEEPKKQVMGCEL
ncbi:capZ-interacting protein-like isoform X2 [Labrus mixtus]|uniref:capZ-interacting protein-like isoform X2 n=1 Tax=Labrus mixtus TaxID=508554 RepID=UPI0029BFC927|nr:capZ-interacting protein-like isoform X2 [Labrus mixtus]